MQPYNYICLSDCMPHYTLLYILHGPLDCNIFNVFSLLVLDELDQLSSSKQSVLYSVFEWPSLPTSRLVLVGIANALDLTDRVLPRLRAHLKQQPELLHFAPYTRQQIVNIITERLTQVNL